MFFLRGKASTIKLDEVFTMGGAPTITYVPREKQRLEGQIKDHQRTKHRIMAMTGPTKIGKTVLWSTVLPKDDVILIDGGQIKTEALFYAKIAELANLPNATTVTKEDGIEAGAVGINGMHARSSAAQYAPPLMFRAITFLTTSNKILVLDDFHQIPYEVQKSIILALKRPIFDGLRVIVISVSHRASDPQLAVPDMHYRVTHLRIPEWDRSELEMIAEKGFAALNIEVDARTIDGLADNCFANPALLQIICHTLCTQHQVFERRSTKETLSVPDLEQVLRRVAETEGSPINVNRLLALSRGQKTNRVEYYTKDGLRIDSYHLLLRAMRARLPTTSLKSVELNDEANKMLKDPQPGGRKLILVNQTTANLKRMSDAAKEVGGEPPLEWDPNQQRVHIVDPFFAFDLKWGSWEQSQ